MNEVKAPTAIMDVKDSATIMNEVRESTTIVNEVKVPTAIMKEVKESTVFMNVLYHLSYTHYGEILFQSSYQRIYFKK